MITESFLMALAMIESGNKDIPGDAGAAIGPLQIHEIYMADVERILKCPCLFTTVKHGPNGECPGGRDACPDDRHSLGASLFATKVYLEFWSTYLRGRRGWEFSHADLCALHRHGPSYKPGAAKSTQLDRVRTRRLAILMQEDQKNSSKSKNNR